MEDSEFETVTIESHTALRPCKVSKITAMVAGLTLLHEKSSTEDNRYMNGTELTIADMLSNEIDPNMKKINLCFKIPTLPGSFLIAGSTNTFITDFQERKGLSSARNHILSVQLCGEGFFTASVMGSQFLFDKDLNLTDAVRNHNPFEHPEDVVITKRGVFYWSSSVLFLVPIRNMIFQKAQTQVLVRRIDGSASVKFCVQEPQETLFFIFKGCSYIQRNDCDRHIHLKPTLRSLTLVNLLRILYSENLIAVEKYGTSTCLYLCDTEKMNVMDRLMICGSTNSKTLNLRLLSPRLSCYYMLLQLDFTLVLVLEHKGSLFRVNNLEVSSQMQTLSHYEDDKWIAVGSSSTVRLIQVKLPAALKL